jgi:hypothetical protein
MLSLLGPSFEVVKVGRISENQTLSRPILGVFLVGARFFLNLNADPWKLLPFLSLPEYYLLTS